MTTNDNPSPTDALPLILAAAAFDHAAKTSATWAADNDQAAATALFSGLTNLLQVELSDPKWSPQDATLDAVSLIARAYAVAAKTVRRTDPSPELGHGEIKQQGCAYAADWLQAHADAFAVIAAQLGMLSPPAEHQGRATFKPAASSGSPAVEFATLAVAQDDQINLTVHPSETEASNYFREHFPADSLHRIHPHTVALVPDRHPLSEQESDQHDEDFFVEFATLAVVQDNHIDVTVHSGDLGASIHLHENFATPLPLHRIASHHVTVSTNERN